MDTVHGPGTLVPHYEKQNGILDHEYIDANEGVWHVTGRVVPLGPSESVYIITLPKPDSLPLEAFEAGMRLMDDELAALKACIESRPAAPPNPVTIVEAVYDAFRRRDTSEIFRLLSPEVQLSQSNELPWGDVYDGHEGAGRFFTSLTSHVQSTVKVERWVQAADHVCAIGWTEGTVNATGAPFRVPIAHLWHVVDGQVVRIQFFIDHPTMLAALNQPAAH
jgi:ketosteroid isomerase-like protein